MKQNYLLELEGRLVGRFFEFFGGRVKGEVIIESSAPGKVAKKHIGSVKVEDMTITCGTGLSKSFYEWIGSAFSGLWVRKSGAVMLLDQKRKVSRRLEFREALVSSVILPELKRSANKDAFITVTISPEYVSAESAGTAKLGVYVSALAKAWNIGSFRLKIAGLEKECAQVMKINSVSLKQQIIDIGAEPFDLKHPMGSQSSGLDIQLPELHAEGFYKWLDDFVAKGWNSTQYEKKGTLEFFAPNSTKAYFGLKFSGLGIIGISGGSALRTKTAKPVSIKMYSKNMSFYAGPSAIM